MPIAADDLEKLLAKGARHRRWPRWILAGIVVAALIGAGLWWRAAGTATATVYTTVPARVADLTVRITATGTVEPTDEVEVSSELSGTILAVTADYNDHVSAGQVLAKLDTGKLQATLDHARGTLASKQAMAAQSAATLAETQSAYNRVAELVKRGSGTDQDLQTAGAALARATAAVDMAAADVQVAQADLSLDKANLDKAAITSPIDGIVLARNVEAGQIVASSLQAPVLFTLAADLRRMDLNVAIDEADIGKVAVGNKAEFTVEAYPDRRFPAEIAQVRYAPQTIDGVVTYQAVLSIDNADLSLRPGMTATAVITVTEVSKALVVPNAALRYTPAAPKAKSGGSGFIGMLIQPPHVQAPSATPPAGGAQRLWVLAGGVATPVDVVAGQTDGTLTQVVSGPLKAGDAVITDATTP
ncbi:MAG: efflux RND transporter periplasmic adaptor subunit [Rhodobacteraceae bacterium]|nr:efflux RND transporter periplasmic adaptor subunit [Paracoccaceae bacterium]